MLVKKRDGVLQATALAAVKQAAQAYPGVKVLDRAQFKAEQTKLIVVLLAAFAGALAAVSPSRRAAKLDVLRAAVTE